MGKGEDEMGERQGGEKHKREWQIPTEGGEWEPGEEEGAGGEVTVISRRAGGEITVISY